MNLTNTDVALLMSEWADDGGCPTCETSHAFPMHARDCAMDRALASRGFPMQAERDAARERIRAGNAPTDPPPSGVRK